MSLRFGGWICRVNVEGISEQSLVVAVMLLINSNFSEGHVGLDLVILTPPP